MGLAAALASLAWPLPEAAERPAALTLRLTDRAGGLLRAVRPHGRGRPVALAEVPATARRALVATEDRRFYRHLGVDLLALGRAAWANLRAGRIVSGGSTLTMQVARLLRGDAGRRSLGAKLAEAHLALRLELRWSKDAILAAWLNRAAFGNRTRGIEAAARLYFGKPARDLTDAEATFLVGLPQSPSRYDPFRHLARAKARQRRVLAALVRAGHRTPAAAARLAAVRLTVQPPEAVFHAPHLTEYLLQREPELAAGRVRTVRTTLDGRLQRRVERLVRGHIHLLSDATVTNAAAVVLDNATGEVLAYVGSADFWDERHQGQNDGVRMRRQPGSALKPFTYARALRDGLVTPASILADVAVQVPEAGGAFAPENYDRRYHGPVSVRTALACSYNVPAVRVARRLGAAALLETLHDAGFASLTRPPSHYGVGLTLGNGEVQLLELARAYAGLARGGTLPPVRFERHRVTARGDTLRPAPAAPTPMRTLTPALAHLVTDILRDPAARAPAFGRGGPLELPFPAAAKTGTSKDFRDNWTVGFTPRHTVAVWAGNFDGTPMQRVSGVAGAGPLFHAILRDLGSGGPFARPAHGLTSARVCPASGQRPGAFCPTARTEPFLAGTAPAAADTCRVHRRVRLDARSGLLASPATPATHVEARVFAVHPPVFHAWMRAHGVPRPPTLTHAAVHAADAANAWSDDVATTEALRVLYPADGTRYRRDPVLRPGYQRLHLDGAAPEGWLDVHWRVDGTRLPGPLHAATWPLAEGAHTLTLHAVAPDGQRYRSRPATVRVFAHAPFPWADSTRTPPAAR